MSTTLTPLANQVAGHAGVQTSSGGAVVVKSCLPVEHHFYTKLAPKLGGPSFVGKITPAFFGVLTLQGKVGEGGTQVQQVKTEDVPKEAIVLENLSHPFVKPNVLDIKLGTQLYDEEASAEKRERMTKAAKDTTSGSHGVRLTGFSVWNPSTQTVELTPKTYGKSITAAQLPEGISRFFPTPSNPSDTQSLLNVLRLILSAVNHVYSTVSPFHWSVRGGSVLIVYEGDPAARAAALERRNALGLKEGEEEDDEEIESDEEEDEREETEAEKEDGGKKRLISHKVRLIDFAHAKEEKETDEGFNLGLRTVIGLLEGRIAELEKEVGKA